MLCCYNVLCIYNENDKCISSEAHSIDSSGMCMGCVMMDVDEGLIIDKKRKAREEFEMSLTVNERRTKKSIEFMITEAEKYVKKLKQELKEIES